VNFRLNPQSKEHRKCKYTLLENEVKLLSYRGKLLLWNHNFVLRLCISECFVPHPTKLQVF